MWVKDWLVFLITPILAMDFCYTKEDICIFSNATLEKVPTCPKNAMEMKERSEKKRCHVLKHCYGNKLVYHCTRDDNGLVEVCAPEKKIIGNSCTFYEKGLDKVVEDYNKNCSECPFTYKSTESFKFSECRVPAMIISSNQTSKQGIDETTETQRTRSNQTTIRTNKTTDMTSSISSPTAKQKETLWTIFPIIVKVVAFIILIVIIFIIYKKWKKERYLRCSQKECVTEKCMP